MPVAVSKAQELHERACALDWGDADAAMALYFQLKSALRSDAGALAIRDALVTTCQIIGYRNEAIEHLEMLDRSWMNAGPALALNAQGWLVNFGFIERGLTRANQLLEALTAPNPEDIKQLAYTAVLTCDQRLLSRLSALDSPSVKNFTAHVGHLSVRPHLPKLQSLALGAAAAYLMNVRIKAADEDPETGTPCFTTTLVIDGSLIHPSDLFDQIHDAQGQYAANFQAESVDWWPHYFVDVKAAPRHHSIPAKPRMRKAA
jgi:hypothetical protein